MSPMHLDTPTSTIYEAAGGAPAFDDLVEQFYARVLEDPLLRPLFVSIPLSDHVHNVALWLGEVFGGAPEYTESRGGHAALIRAHGSRGITEQQRARWVELMVETARDTLPDVPGLQDRLAEYFDWGSRIALAASQPGFVDRRPDEPAPRWGWDGLASRAGT
jgi:hemoglobin